MTNALDGDAAKRFDERVDALAEDAFAFLERLVAAPSTLGREERAQEVLAEELDRLGFAVSSVSVPDAIAQHPAAGLPQIAYDGRRDVLGRWQGDRPVLLFNGHMDVVPADATAWGADPYVPVRRDGWLVGRGAGDMKGGFAMVVLALRALAEAAPQALEVPLGFLSVIEEECTGNGTLAAVLEGISADAVVLPEPSDLGALLAGIGVVWVDVEIVGAGGHAHAADRLLTPVGALGRLIEAFEELGRTWSAECPDAAFAGVDQPYTVNVGTIESGDWRSSVAPRARLGVRFGHPRAWRATDVVERVTATARQCLANEDGAALRVSVQPSGFRAEGYALAPDHELVEMLARCHEAAHGTSLRRFGLNSTTDARYYINQLGVPALCYGPVARNMHGVDEGVELSSVVAGARTIGRLVAHVQRAAAAGRPITGLGATP